MGVLKNKLRNRLKGQNDGGVRSVIYIQALSDFTTVKKPLDLKAQTITTHADIATRDASSPSDGDFCFVTDQDQHYKYVTAAWVAVDHNQIIEDHVLTTGFAKFETSDLDDRGLNITGPEEPDSTGAMTNVPLFIAGLDTKAINAAKELLLEPVIALVPDRNGRYFQLGSELDPATMKIAEGTGTKGKSTGAPGIMFNLESDSWPVEYNGAISTL